MASPAVSVIVASDRRGPDLDACLASLSAQIDAPPFEVIVVSAQEPPRPEGLLVGWVRMEERNPAMRRNRGADYAAGSVLAFIDDDAAAAPDWLVRGAAATARTEVAGGIDLVPPGSPWGERVADLLIATPVIGSGIPAHERHPRGGPLRAPSDLALCNLFVARPLFDRLGGFDETLGYIGEDTDFVRRALESGAVAELDPALAVFHRRRAFPAALISQRWRYRVKSGRLLVERPRGAPIARILTFLAGGALVSAAALIFGRRFIVPAAAVYAGATWTLSAPIWRRDAALFPVVPAAFFIHHANYWLATVAGVALAALRPRASDSAAAGPSGAAVTSGRLPTHPR